MVIPGDVQLWDRSATGATRKKRDPFLHPTGGTSTVAQAARRPQERPVRSRTP